MNILLEIAQSLDETQQGELLAFAEKLLQGKKDDLIPTPYYNPEQLSYSYEDILNIIQQFPDDKKWFFADLQNEYIFPPEHFIKVEIIDHKIYVMPNPSYQHQEILTLLSAHMTIFISANKLGSITVAPVSVKMDEGNVVEPDILFISIAQMEANPKIIQKQFVQGSPQLVVEIISPANYKKLREAKKQRYAETQVEEYWEILPEKKQVKIEVLETKKNEEGEHVSNYKIYSEAEKTGTVKSKILEGFQLDVATIFNS